MLELDPQLIDIVKHLKHIHRVPACRVMIAIISSINERWFPTFGIGYKLIILDRFPANFGRRISVGSAVYHCARATQKMIFKIVKNLSISTLKLTY